MTRPGLPLLNVFEVEADGARRHLVCFLDTVLAGARGIDARSVVGEYVPGPDGGFDPDSFRAGYSAASEFVDGLPHERVAIGGFSQGAVMSFAVGLGRGRPRPAAILAFSGFIPEVPGWELDDTPPFPPCASAIGTSTLHFLIIGLGAAGSARNQA